MPEVTITNGVIHSGSKSLPLLVHFDQPEYEKKKIRDRIMKRVDQYFENSEFGGMSK